MESFAPHGNCYLWQTNLIGLHAISDGLIALAYFAIPTSIVYLFGQRNDLPFKNIFVLFAVFIISCGVTHLMEVVTLWYPFYWVSGTLKAFTALISLYTVVEIILYWPTILAWPSPAQLEAVNEQLKEEIAERKDAEEKVKKLNQQLEKRVEERTAELAQSKRFVQSIVDINPNALYIYNLQKECFTYVSRSIKSLLGYFPETITQSQQHPIERMVYQEDREKLYSYYQDCSHLQQGETLAIEYRVQDARKQWRWLCSRSTVFSRTETGIAKEILGTAADVTARKEAEANFRAVNQKLENRVEELKQRNQEMQLLGEMNEFLQSCLSLEEANRAIAHLLEPLFPHCSGAIFLKNASETVVEKVASWGEAVRTQATFFPNHCWALRRSRPHGGDKNKPGLFCCHIHSDPYPNSSLCLPMMAQGETLGLLYLNTEQNNALTTAKRQLARNVSEQIALALANLRLREELQYQSIRDGLTGLYNRRYLEECLERELDRAQRTQQSLGIIMIDVDHFKQFNDTWGHSAGDQVLKEIGQFLRQNLRSSDIACRYGGEELTLVLPETKAEEAYQCAEKLRLGIRELSLEYNQKPLPKVTASLGIAMFPEQGTDLETLTKLADAALYQAKQQGRDQVVTAHARSR